MKAISFQSKGQRVDGTLFLPDTTKRNPGVIFFHGSGSSQKNYIPMAEELVKKGIAALTLSLRGHGTSEGFFDQVTAEDNILDALAAYDFFLQTRRS